MYVWKFWRDTRRSIGIYLGLLFLFGVFWLSGMFKENRVRHIFGDPRTTWFIELGITFAMTYLCALVMSFTIGTNSVGTDIGKGTGDFLVTRPRSRKYFVWAGWSAGIVELLVLMVVTAAFVFALTAFVTGPIWRQVSSPMHVSVGHQATLDVWLMVATSLLTAAVIYGLTYFMSIVLRSGQRGVMAALAIVFAYSVIASALRQFADISMPSLNLMESTMHSASQWYLEPRVQTVGWMVLSLAFPLGAQIFLDRVDI